MKEGYCKATVYPNEKWGYFSKHQCTRKAISDGYCKIHSPDSVEKRQKESAERWEAKKKTQCWYRLDEANKKIERLEKEVKRLKRKINK